MRPSRAPRPSAALTNSSLNKLIQEGSASRGRLLYITLERSASHQEAHIKASVDKLGLTKRHKTVLFRDTPYVRGLVYAVRHLVSVEAKGTEELFPQGYEDFLPNKSSAIDKAIRKARKARAQATAEREEAKMKELPSRY